MLSVSGINATGGTVSVEGATFTSLDPGIATVDARGMVYGVANGMARIEVKAAGLRDTFRISIGGRLLFNVSSMDACTMPTMRDARIVMVSDHAVIAEDLDNPPGGFTDADYRHIAATFDTLIYPVVTNAFGTPQDVDGNQRVIMLYTSAVNALTARGSQSFVAGFFFSRDLFPTESRNGLQGCGSSNQAEMFYMLAPDPDGEVNGNKRTREFVLSRTLSTVGHEFQHLINASRRLFESNASEFETIWLNEGLSHIAEELLFYEASGLGTGQRLHVDGLRSSPGAVAAFNLYGGGNFARVAEYMENPSSESPYEKDDNLATRGATWSFLRYAADRAGRNNPGFWRSLSGASSIGFSNLDAAFGTSTLQWVADWAVANATDHYGITNSVDERFRHRSWDMHDVLDELNLSTLNTVPLADGQTATVSVKAGGSAHLRFRVDAGDASVVTALQGSAAPSCGSSSRRAMAVGDVVQGTLAQLGALCLTSNQSGQSFVLTASHLAPLEGATTNLTITGSGLISPPQPRSVSEGGSLTLSRSRAIDGADNRAAEFEHRLRQREITELEWRLPGSGALKPSLQTSGGSGDVVLTLVRVR